MLEDPSVEMNMSNASLYSWLLIAAVIAVIGGFIWRNSRSDRH